MNRFCWTLIGPTGSGKTHLWKMLMAQFIEPIIILDRVGDCGDFGLTVDSAEHLRRYILTAAAGKVEWVPRFVIEQATVKNGAALFKLARESGLGGTFIVDEAHNWYPAQGRQNEHLHQMLMEGRHDNQSLVFCTRRPQNLGKNALNESAVTSFALNDPGARTRAAKYMGPEVGEQQISSLGEYEFLTGGRAHTLPWEMPEGWGRYSETEGQIIETHPRPQPNE